MAPRAAKRGATDDNDYVNFVAAGGDRDARAAQHESERIEAIHFSIPALMLPIDVTAGAKQSLKPRLYRHFLNVIVPRRK